MGAVEGVFRPPWQEQYANQRGVRQKGKGDTKQRRSSGYAEKEQEVCRRAIDTLFGPLFVDNRLDPLE